MNKKSCDNHIANLKKIRDAHRSQLDDGVLSDIEHLISDLEKVRNGSFSEAAVSEIAMRVLKVIGVVLAMVSNIRDWMN